MPDFTKNIDRFEQEFKIHTNQEWENGQCSNVECPCPPPYQLLEYLEKALSQAYELGYEKGLEKSKEI